MGRAYLLLELVLLLVSMSSYGLKQVNDISSIVGGRVASIEEFPYIASYFGGDRQPSCGACILSETIILTAQHCIEGYRHRGFIGVGKSRLTEMAKLLQIKYIVPYPRYIDPGIGKDIAILVLENPLQFSKEISPIQLASPQDESNGLLSPGSVVDVIGWGSTRGGKFPIYPDRLRAAEVKITSIAFAEKTGFTDLTPDQLPAGQFPGDGRVDSCFGDSGGPLVTKSKLLVGTTSWGDDCADGIHPGMTIPANGLRSGQFLVPRGLRMIHFLCLTRPREHIKMQIATNGASGNCYTTSEENRIARCSFVAPIEGLYDFYIWAKTSIRNGKLDVLLEADSPPRVVETVIANLTIPARDRLTLPLFSTVPGTGFTATIVRKAPANAVPRIVIGESDVSGSVETKLTSAKTATSVKLIGDASRTTTLDLLVQYTSYRNDINTTSLTYSFPSLLGSKKIIIPVPLRVGSELGARFWVQRGLVLFFVGFGEVKSEWECLNLQTHGYCGGIVPGHSGNAFVTVETPVTEGSAQFSLILTYEPADTP